MEPTRSRPRRRRTPRRVLALVLATVAASRTSAAPAATAAAVAAPGTASSPAASAAARPATLRPTSAAPRRGRVAFRAPGAARGLTAAAGVDAQPKLSYYGGPVMSTVKIAHVLYGTGTFVVPPPGAGTIPLFLQGLASSGYIAELAEYDTTISDAFGRPGTQQHITAGSYLGSFTITPGRNGNLLQDTDVQAELASQIDAGVLPAPTTDADGHGTTLYTVFFRNGQRICDGASCSLQAGGFCAYHSGFHLHGGTGPMVLYTVNPDLAGFGNAGCGPGNDYQVTTAALSHEVSEGVTDPEVGLAEAVDKPLAWYDFDDSGLGENADICEQNYGALTLGAIEYTVQQTWSNASEACITMGVPRAPGEFQLQPKSAVLLVGGSTAITVRVLGTGSSTYSVAGLPPGVTGAFSANPLDLGQAATLSLTAAETTVPGTYTALVSNTPADKHVALSLVVVAANGSAASALDPDAPLARLVDTRTTGTPVGAGAVLRVHSTASGATAVVLNVVATEATRLPSK